MPHAGLIGMTNSGKTTLGIEMARQYRAQRFAVLVCDPKKNPGWPADWMTTDIREFVHVAKNSLRCILFVEEAGDFGKEDEFPWLFTQARNWGHVTHYLSQYHRQVPPIVRGNIERLFLFKAGNRCVKEFSDEFAEPRLSDLVAQCGHHQYVKLGRYEPPRIQTLNLNGRAAVTPTKQEIQR